MIDQDKNLSQYKKAYQALWSKLFVTTEGRIFALGLGISILGLIIMGVVALWSPDTSRMIGALTFTNVIFGRAVSMSIGYAAGHGHLLVVSVNMVTETILVLLFYPLFVFSLKKLVVFPALKTFLERANEAAVAHEDKVRRYGIIGLFVFVWFPFWMTGPVVGSAIGYLLGFSAMLNLSVVLAGTFIAMAAWGYFLSGLQQRAAEVGPFAPALIITIIIVIVLTGYFMNYKRRTHGDEDSDRNSNEKEDRS